MCPPPWSPFYQKDIPERWHLPSKTSCERITWYPISWTPRNCKHLETCLRPLWRTLTTKVCGRVCQRLPHLSENQSKCPSNKSPLQYFNTNIKDEPFQHVLMDLITDLPKLDGFDSILTIVDQGCLKAAKFIPCPKMIDRPGVANKYLKHLVS